MSIHDLALFLKPINSIGTVFVVHLFVSLFSYLVFNHLHDRFSPFGNLNQHSGKELTILKFSNLMLFLICQYCFYVICLVFQITAVPGCELGWRIQNL